MSTKLPDCHYRVSVKGFLLDETRARFLIIQEDNGTWELPGGGLDHGETPEDCLRREIQEEMGLEVTWIDTRPSYFFTFEKKENTEHPGWKANVVYEIRTANLHITPTNECARVQFVAPDEALKLKGCPNVHELAKLFAKSPKKGTRAG